MIRPLLVLAIGLVAQAADPPSAMSDAPPALVHVEARVRTMAPRLDRFCRALGIDGPAGPNVGTSRGTGFVVGTPPVVVTNHHVVAGAVSVQITDAAGQLLLDTDRADAIRPAAHADLAILSLPGHDHALTLAPAAPHQGDATTLLGWSTERRALRHGGTLGDTIHRALPGGPARSYRLTTAQVARGMSGGPALNEDGEVIGVIVAGSEATSDLQGQGLLVPWDDLTRALAPAQDTSGGSDSALSVDAEGRLLTVPAGASRLGLSVGDRITAVADVPTPDGGAVRAALAHRSGPVVVMVQGRGPAVLP